ncbi:regulatory protein [Pectobacterium atrosepticum SCRI1043]|uniref:Regulatory protein n=1 Tax=Pectobacterium atrosepticum (strain SCRI 1043 / ATCC BAA-672) TaxID=218491 RepID=Q6D5K5_PECAS|nr:EamA family transporter [Pectobacterium atrosepticum]GKV83868.1 ABC transporter permease [Pectobacterium carotovorum subsp. carotovorum]AIA70867.1 ABC transporter permease [Pectobacterium atrosepticum]AIK14360.1 regulatory protein [Pectobacterium atrosepticum]ATY91113.1 EamA family transporter [Pectobacterium atrosepticum]KFX12984.1 ABC transporter permease [Pectobacterium atrosepticum]
MNTPSPSHYWRDVILTALAPAIWGSTYIVTSEFLPPDRPFTAAFIRVLPAGLLLLLFTRVFPARRDWWRVVVLSALNIGVFQALLFVAAYRLPGGLAAVLGAIQPLLVMVLVWAVDHHAPKLATLWSAIIGVIGMSILLLSPQTTFEPVGIAAALLGAVCMATGVWLTRRWQLDLPVLPLTGWQLFIGGLMLAPVAWLADAPLPTLTLSQWAAYAYLCLAGAVLAYGLWFRGVSRLPTVAVASLGLLSPLTAVLLGWALLSQSMTGTAFLGLAIVLASVFAVQWTTARSR